MSSKRRATLINLYFKNDISKNVDLYIKTFF